MSLLLAFLWAGAAFGQTGCLSKRISLAADNQTVESVLQSISARAGCQFSYSPDVVPINKRVTFPEKLQSVQEFLRITLGEGFAYRETSSQVIIYPAKARRQTLHGHVRDSTSGEFLFGANIYIPEVSSGVSTNAYGFYSISLPAGEYTVRCTYLGYRTLEKKILIDENPTLEIILAPEETTLDEIVVSAASESIEERQPSVHELSIAQVRAIPALGGETDVIKTIQMLPGVKTLGEGSSGFFVRGGDLDQNLILLDEAPVYNPSHLLGFFSAFNPDAIKDVRLYAGTVPAQFGGRLSSLLDIRMKDGNFHDWSYSGGIGLISSRFTVEGPIQKDKSSVIIAMRRTYADLLLAAIDNPELNDTKLNFYDLNAKFNARLNKRNSIFFSAYSGSDVFQEKELFNIGWGNRTATLRWNHLYSDRLFSNTSLIYSRFNYQMAIESRQPASVSRLSIEDYNLKSDFTFFVKTDHTINFGVNAIAHQFNPGMLDRPSERSVGIPRQFAMEYAGYVSSEHKLERGVSIEYGLRYSAMQNIGDAVVYQYNDEHHLTDSASYGQGETYHMAGGIEPRLKVKAETTVGTFTVGYGRMRQYIQRLSNYTGSFSSPEIWMPAGPNIKPQISDQVSISWSRDVAKETVLSVETYYKNMLHVIDYKDHAVLDLNQYIEGQIREGRGRAYGIEMQLQKSSGRWTGWVSYTLSKTEKKTDGINDGKYYPARYDRPHAATIVTMFKASDRWQLSANWVFMTGEAVTVPTGSYQYAGKTVPIYSARNAHRLPDYHRLDISATLFPKAHKQRKFSGSWTFGVYNAYFRKNAFALNYNRTVDQFGNVIDQPMMSGAPLFSAHKATTKTWLFGIVPSVTYNFKF